MLDREIAAHVQMLTGRDQNAAYAALQALERESAESDGVFAYWDAFAAMLAAKSGFVRARGLRLLAANARWAQAGKAEPALPQILRHIVDEKPIVARQCIQSLPELGRGRPAWIPAIRAALLAADTSRYADSMRPLIDQDRASALEQLQQIENER